MIACRRVGLDDDTVHEVGLVVVTQGGRTLRRWYTVCHIYLINEDGISRHFRGEIVAENVNCLECIADHDDDDEDEDE